MKACGIAQYVAYERQEARTEGQWIRQLVKKQGKQVNWSDEITS
jgi:hypothetical protein